MSRAGLVLERDEAGQPVLSRLERARRRLEATTTQYQGPLLGSEAARPVESRVQAQPEQVPALQRQTTESQLVSQPRVSRLAAARARLDGDNAFLSRANSRQTLPPMQQDQPGMPSTTASQLTRPASLENLGSTIGDFAQVGADFIQSAPYGAVKDAYDQAAGFGARLANNPTIGRAMEAIGLRPDLANDTSGYQPDVQPPDSIAGQLGRGVGSIGSMFAASALTGGGAAIMPIMAGAQSLGATYQAARDRALQMGADEAQAHQIAAAEADTMGLVSTVTSLPVGKALSGIAPQALVRAVATANRGGQLGQLVKTAVAEGSQEAAEEAASMILQRVAEDDPAAFQDWQKRIAISAGAGAIGGGLIAGGAAVLSQPSPKSRLETETQTNAQEADTFQTRDSRSGQERADPQTDRAVPVNGGMPENLGLAETLPVSIRIDTPLSSADPSANTPQGSLANPRGTVDTNLPPEGTSEVVSTRGETGQPVPSNLSSLTIAELRSLDLQRGGTGKGTKAAVVKRLGIAKPTSVLATPSQLPDQKVPVSSEADPSAPQSSSVGQQTPSPSVSRESWQMTRGEFEAMARSEAGLALMQNARMHRGSVLEALASGKDVPQNVVDEYPGIVAEAAAARANAQESDRSVAEATRQREELEQRRKNAPKEAYQRGVEQNIANLNKHEAYLRDDAWKKTKGEYVTYKRGGAKQLQEGEHRDAVAAAVEAGKPVPPEVLADYPDLKPKAATPEATAQTTPKWGVYPTEVSGRGTMFAVRESDNPRGFGDTIHPTRKAAETYAKEASERAAKNAESRRASEEAAQAKAAKEEAARKEREDVGGFADGLDPMRKGKVLKDLDAMVRVGGVVDTTRNHVKRLVAEGAELTVFEENKIKPVSRTRFNRMTQKEQEWHQKDIEKGGKVTVYRIGGYGLGKTAYDYAKFLKSQAPTPPQPSRAKAPNAQETKANDKAQAPFESKRPETIKAGVAPDVGRAPSPTRGGVEGVAGVAKAVPPSTPTPPAPVEGGGGKELPTATIDDIDEAVAVRAFANTSHVPEKRGESYRRMYVESFENTKAELAPLADTPEKMAMLADELTRFKDGLRQRYLAYFHSHANVASSMVTGPANFPVAANQKRMGWADNKWSEVVDYSKRAVAAIRKKIAPESSGVIRSDQKNAAELIAKELDEAKRLQEAMRQTNKIVTDKSLTREQKIAKIEALGFPPDRAAELFTPKFGREQGFPQYRLTNNRANIKRLEGRLAQVQSMTANPARNAGFEGGRVEENKEDMRVRIVYDARPDSATVAKLKRSGFRWSPTNKAWQRLGNEAGWRAALEVTGAKEAQTAPAVAETPAPTPEPAPSQPTPAPKDMAALRAKYPGVDFKPVRGVYIPSTLRGKALAEWRNTASGVPFKDQIALLDKRLAQTAKPEKIQESAAPLRGQSQTTTPKKSGSQLPDTQSPPSKTSGRDSLRTSEAVSPRTTNPQRPAGEESSPASSSSSEDAKNESQSNPKGPSQPPSAPKGSPKSRADKIVDAANKIADEAKKRRQERTITRSNKPGERTGGSPLIPDAIDFGIEIAARAVAKGITGGQALTKHISAALKTLPEELKPYGGRVRYVARRVVMGATKNGVFQPSLMADSIQTERLRHAENDETVKARQKLHKIVGGTDKAKAEPKLRQEIDENLGVRKAPTYTVGGPVDLESLLPEHRYAIATLYTSVKRGKAISGTNEAADFIQAQTEKGLANLFTPEMLAELRGLEGRGAKGGMTPDQMDLISRAIQHVAHLSKTERTATVLGQIRQLDEDGAAVVGELEGRVDIPKQGLIDKAMGRAEKEPNPGIVRRFLVRAQDSLGDMLHVAFGDGVMKRYGYEAIAKAEGAKRLEYIKADKKLREVLERHKVKAEDVGKATKNPTTFNLPNAGEVKIPAMEALDVVLMAGDQQNTALLVKNGVLSKRFRGQNEKKIELTEADIEVLGQQLPKWLMDFGRTGVEIINGYTDQVNATSVAIDGVEIAEKRTGSDYYYPRSPDDVLRTAGVRQDEMVELAWAERLGFTKKRSGSSVPYQIKPAIERIRDHIDGVTTYIHMAEPTLNVRKLIARPEVLENVQKRLGTAWRKKLLRHLNESQGMIAPPESEIQGAARWLLRNTARTALWGRLSSAMAQTAGVPMLMNRMTGKERAHFLKHLAKLDWVKNPTVMREMTEASGYFADRYPETGEQTRLGSGIDFESTIPTTPMGRWYNEGLRWGFKPMEYGDKVLSALAYMAAKDAGHPDPVFRAEMLIRQSQNATSPMDRSGMMLEGERNALVGALALFSSAPNRVRGQIRADLSDVRANPKNGKAWAKLAATVLAAGIAAVMGESIRELWRRQKVGFNPEDKPRTGTDHLVNTLATLGDSIVPKGGQILRGAINGIRGKVSQTFDAPGMDLADSLGKLLGHLDADEEKAKRLGPNIDRALRAFTSFTGIVGEPVYDLGVGIARTVNPPASIAAYSKAVRAGDTEEARRIAAELRKANPKIDLKARRKNYEERVGIRKPQK